MVGLWRSPSGGGAQKKLLSHCTAGEEADVHFHLPECTYHFLTNNRTVIFSVAPLLLLFSFFETPPPLAPTILSRRRFTESYFTFFSIGHFRNPNGSILAPQHFFRALKTSVPRSPLPSTEQGAERTEQPNIARCSVQFGNIPCAPVRFGCSVRHISRGCCSALVLDYFFFFAKI